MIQPNEIRQWWPYVKKGLETIQKKSPEFWIPEDVYAELLYQKAMLWVFSESSGPVGFVVLQPRENQVLHIWAAHANKTDRMPEAFEIIKEIAKQGNMEKLTFDSWRKGWEKMGKKLGFKPRSYVMDMDMEVSK